MQTERGKNYPATPEIVPQETRVSSYQIEGAFGKVEVDVTAPSITRLYLRGPRGLSRESVLASISPRPPSPRERPWATEGYSYVVDQDNRRYESRLGKPDKVDISGKGARAVLRIQGVKLTSGNGEKPVATEDWVLSAPGDGTRLVWKITRQWQGDITAIMSGSPGLFFGFNARIMKNSVTSTIWYDPLRLTACANDLYVFRTNNGTTSRNLVQTIRDRDTWAIYKLWTNYHEPADLGLEVQGGHLYRRGGYAFLSEAGAVASNGAVQTYRKGQTEEITLNIFSADKQATGYQLDVTLPDKTMEASLKDFYGSVLNGGAINDQKSFDFGNETDGYYYAGSSWMYGMALSAGIPGDGQLSSHPYDVCRAFREHLANVLSVVDDQGREHFGFDQTGEFVDCNLQTIIGMCAYMLHSGNIMFVRQNLPILERMMEYFIQRRDDRGLFKLGKESSGDPAHGGVGVHAHWYYDSINTSGINGYYNAFFYKAASDLAEMETAADCPEKAEKYRAIARQIKQSFNKVLWKENASGGPRYIDWIDTEGNEITYFCDICQWPAVAFGIASPEQARKIVATADARIAQLEKEYGYQGFASLSALWPQPASIQSTPLGKSPFGRYMNGGSLLAQTYWEIVARTKAGDHEGAVRRLQLFARRFAEISWAGDNACDICGDMKYGDTEAYLADMVVTAASVIHGIMGITPNWDRLEVEPHLPASWPRAEAKILYKGRKHSVVIENGQAHVQALEQVINPSFLWNMDFNLRTVQGREAVISNTEFCGQYHDSVALKKSVASGTYQSPWYDWATPVKLADLTVAADLHGGEATVIIETSNDGFKTVVAGHSIKLLDGVNTYPPGALTTPMQMVRLRFDLTRGLDAATSPVIDGFRVLATP